MNETQLGEVARFCNRFPNIEVSYEVVDEGDLHAGSPVVGHVQLERDLEEDEEVPSRASSQRTVIS